MTNPSKTASAITLSMRSAISSSTLKAPKIELPPRRALHGYKKERPDYSGRSKRI